MRKQKITILKGRMEARMRTCRSVWTGSEYPWRASRNEGGLVGTAPWQDSRTAVIRNFDSSGACQEKIPSTEVPVDYILRGEVRDSFCSVCCKAELFLHRKFNFANVNQIIELPAITQFKDETQTPICHWLVFLRKVRHRAQEVDNPRVFDRHVHLELESKLVLHKYATQDRHGN